MLLDKVLYGEVRTLVSQKNYKELQAKLSDLNDALVIGYVQDYIVSSGKNIDAEIGNAKRFQAMISPAIENKLSYCVGFFNAIIFIFEQLLSRKKDACEFERILKALSVKPNEKKILDYLYLNPDSQHKTIAERTGLKENYLSELMRGLEAVGCVERYGVGKRSFYSLTKSAHEFIKEQRKAELPREWRAIMKFDDGKYAMKQLEVYQVEEATTIGACKYRGKVSFVSDEMTRA